MTGRPALSNYERTLSIACGCFLEHDQGAIVRRFGLDSDDDFIYVRFLSRLYRIGRRDGVISSGAGPAGFDDGMTILDVLCCAEEGASPSGEYAGIASVRGAPIGASPGDGAFFAKYARAFDKCFEDLPAALGALGGESVLGGDGGQSGQKQKQKFGGDLAYRLPLFDFLDIVFKFSRADEDFPADARILWDMNVLSYMKFETTFFAANHVFGRIAGGLGANFLTGGIR